MMVLTLILIAFYVDWKLGMAVIGLVSIDIWFEKWKRDKVRQVTDSIFDEIMEDIRKKHDGKT